MLLLSGPKPFFFLLVVWWAVAQLSLFQVQVDSVSGEKSAHG